MPNDSSVAVPPPAAIAETRWSRYLSKLRVSVSYRWRHGRWPDLEAPRSFNELVQWRKLHNRDEGLARLTDKLEAKKFVGERLGGSATVPTLWSGTVLPELPPAPLPLMVKANHGCNQSITVRSHAEWQKARQVAPRWLKRAYGRWLDEWHYARARRLLLVEPLLGSADTLPIDYKIHVFRGRAEVVQVHLDRGKRGLHRWVQLDRSWRRLSAADGAPDPLPPATLAEMLSAAERLGEGIDALRVDFYEVDGRMLFGEFCLFPGSGLDPFNPVELDERWGALWSGVSCPPDGVRIPQAELGILRPVC